MKLRGIAASLGLATLIFTSSVAAQGMMGGPGYGPGMGMGPGMMGGPGYGPGMGMGPGMMGGQGFGPGMGMGPGMMGGQGFAPCHGAGPGGMWPFLEPDQREDMSALLERHRDAQTERMSQMMELREAAMAQMQEARPDPDAIQELHSRMAQLQGEMMGDRVRLHNAMQDLLTEEQRQQLQQGMPMQRGQPASPSTTE